MKTMEKALWDLFENQKSKGLVAGMRQTLAKMEKNGLLGPRYFNAMGELALLEKNFVVAVRYFRQALGEQEVPEYELNLGNALFYLRDLEGARGVLQGYLDKHPADCHARVNLANCLIEMGKLDEAETTCRQGLEAGGGGRGALLNCLGQVAYIKADFPAALDNFHCAFLESPEYVDALFNRANAKYMLGRSQDALADYALCLRKDENHGPALLNKALVHLDRGEAGDAKNCARQALLLDPASSEAHYILARAHMVETDYRLSRDAFRTALSLEPNHVPSLLGLAKLSLLEAELDEARAMVHRVLGRMDLEPEESRAALSMLFELGDYDKCLARMEEMPKEQVLPALGLLYTSCLWKTGRRKEALAQMEKQLHTEGESPETLILLGKMLAENQAGELAEKRLRRALQLDPAASEAAFELAGLLRAQKRDEEALDVLEMLLSSRPGDPDCLYNLACLQARRGNHDDALHYLKKAIEAGFQDQELILQDPDLINLREFKELSRWLSGTGPA